MNKTVHLGLSQWDLTDRIRMEDFNRDNKTIDDALRRLEEDLGDSPGAKLGSLSTKLGALETALAAKGLQSIAFWKSNGSGGGGGYTFPPGLNWDDWALVAFLVSYPGKQAGDAQTLSLYVHNKSGTPISFTSLPMPGYLLVFLPMHDGSANCTGFLLADQCIPFYQDFSFKDLTELGIFIDAGGGAFPNIPIFGVK